MRADASGGPTRVGLIGFGRIGRRIARHLARTPGQTTLVAVLVRPDQRDTRPEPGESAALCTTWAEFLQARPTVAVECASAGALAALGVACLASGIDLIPLSLAALADAAVEQALLAAAAKGPGRLEIAAGAMGSIDFLAAARIDALRAVTFRATYPPKVWIGTPAESMVDLASLTAPCTFLRTSVRSAVALFPRHINVAVGVALAGLGLDQTQAELAADPAITQATFEIDADAGPGQVRLTVSGRNAPLGSDPVDYTTFSVLRLLQRRNGRIAI